MKFRHCRNLLTLPRLESEMMFRTFCTHDHAYATIWMMVACCLELFAELIAMPTSCLASKCRVRSNHSSNMKLIGSSNCCLWRKKVLSRYTTKYFLRPTRNYSLNFVPISSGLNQKPALSGCLTWWYTYMKEHQCVEGKKSNKHMLFLNVLKSIRASMRSM